MFRTTLLIHLASTLYMVGLIWFVQVVHYPLFDGVGREDFADYEARHTYLTGWAVVPPMLLELTTALWLAWRPGPIDAVLVYTGLVLVVALWTTTFFVQVPCHRRLSDGFDADTHRRLVTSNWLRTVGWTARGGLVLAILWPLIG